MAAKLDIKASTSMTRDKNGYKAQRIATVTGVVGTKDQKMYQAITDPGLPAYGSAHPSIADITLQRISAEMIAHDKARVTLSYYSDPAALSGSANASVRVSAGTATDERKVDLTGNAMQTQYHGGAGNALHQETFKSNVEVPRLTFDFQWTETTFPKSIIDTYLGKINATAWNGYLAKTMLCIAINVTQPSSGADYQVRMSLAYNDDTWDFIAKVLIAPSDITSSTDPLFDITTGTKTFDVYPQVDFTPLGLTL